jgi:hypothetical protein
MTHDHVVLASDRRLTFADTGNIHETEVCKLVNLCNVCGIGYSGLAYLDGKPTHEWIATQLADANCLRPADAVGVLAKALQKAVLKYQQRHRRTCILLAGWDELVGTDGLSPHLVLISNFHDDQFNPLPVASEVFIRFRTLPVGQPLAWTSIGTGIEPARARALDRRLKGRLAKEAVDVSALMRLLVNEIQNNPDQRVGETILALCIPKKAAIHVQTGGRTGLFAKRPGAEDEVATFVYFDPAKDAFEQHGPTFACGRMAHSFKSGSTPDGTDYVEAKILRVPRSPGS